MANGDYEQLHSIIRRAAAEKQRDTGVTLSPDALTFLVEGAHPHKKVLLETETSKERLASDVGKAIDIATEIRGIEIDHATLSSLRVQLPWPWGTLRT